MEVASHLVCEVEREWLDIVGFISTHGLTPGTTLLERSPYDLALDKGKKIDEWIGCIRILNFTDSLKITFKKKPNILSKSLIFRANDVM